MTATTPDHSQQPTEPQTLSSMFPEGGDDPDFFIPADVAKQDALICKIPGLRNAFPQCS